MTFPSVFDIPSTVTCESCVLYIALAAILYSYINSYINEHRRAITEKLKNLSDFSKEIYNDLFNYMSESNKYKKQTDEKVSLLIGNSDDFKIRIESLESAFKKLVVDESLLLEEELKNLQIKKQNAWTPKSKEKYNTMERSVSRRSVMYKAAQKFKENNAEELEP
jgi:hypothetical protein